MTRPRLSPPPAPPCTSTTRPASSRSLPADPAPEAGPAASCLLVSSGRPVIRTIVAVCVRPAWSTQLTLIVSPRWYAPAVTTRHAGRLRSPRVRRRAMLLDARVRTGRIPRSVLLGQPVHRIRRRSVLPDRVDRPDMGRHTSYHVQHLHPAAARPLTCCSRQLPGRSEVTIRPEAPAVPGTAGRVARRRRRNWPGCGNG